MRKHLFALVLGMLGTSAVSIALMGIDYFGFNISVGFAQAAPFGIIAMVATGAWAFVDLPGLLPQEPFLKMEHGQVRASWLQYPVRSRLTLLNYFDTGMVWFGRVSRFILERNSIPRITAFASVLLGGVTFYGTGGIGNALLVAMGTTAALSLVLRSGFVLPRFAHDSMHC